MDKDFISIVNEEINNTDNTNYKIYLEKLINFYKEPSKYISEINFYIITNDFKMIIFYFTQKYVKAKQLRVMHDYSILRVESELKATEIMLKKDYSGEMFKHKLEFQEKLEKLTKMTEEERNDESGKKIQEIFEEYWEYKELITKKVIEKLGISEKVELNKDEETVKEFNGEELKIQESNDIKNEDLKKATDLILNCIKEAKEEILTEIKNNKK